MDYTIFDKMDTGVWAQREGENDQAYMERVFRGVFACGGDEEDASINDMMEGKYIGCHYEEKRVDIEFPVQKWALNPRGNMHGGLLATAVDLSFGAFARFMKKSGKTATISLSIDFIKSIPMGSCFVVSVKLNKFGRRIAFLSSEVRIKDSQELAATASGTFAV